MMRLILPALLLLALAPLAQAQHPCDALSTGCPVRPIVAVHDDRACVGVAFEIGGTALCWDADEPTCVTRHFGFAYSRTCVPPEDLDLDRILP